MIMELCVFSFLFPQYYLSRTNYSITHFKETTTGILPEISLPQTCAYQHPFTAKKGKKSTQSLTYFHNYRGSSHFVLISGNSGILPSRCGNLSRTRPLSRRPCSTNGKSIFAPDSEWGSVGYFWRWMNLVSFNYI